MKIGIIGLGLIGGSIARAAKKILNAEIVAYSRSEPSLKEALSDGILSGYSTNTLDIFAECSIIFVCTPVDKITSYCEKLKNIVSPDTIITDVGSTKEHICLEMEKINGINFIGGHPMAGTEFSGYSASKEDLFSNAVYVLTPLSDSNPKHIKKLKDFVCAIGAKPVVMESKKHDLSVSAVSHVPHIIAYSLANAVGKIEDDEMAMHTLAAGGFKDTTRVASSSPEVWSAICRENKDNVIKTSRLFIEEMQKAVALLESERYNELSEYFSQAKSYRDSFGTKGKDSIIK